MRITALTALLLSLIVGFYSFLSIQALQQDLRSLHAELDNFQENVRTLHIPEEVNKVALYFIKSTPTDFLLKRVIREIPVPASPQVALEELLKGPLPQEELEPSVPEGTKLFDLQIDNKLATANFSEEIKTNFLGGSSLEAHLISAIVKTLTEFSNIDRVQILVAGEKIETIGGHLKIDEPLSLEE